MIECSCGRILQPKAKQHRINCKCGEKYIFLRKTSKWVNTKAFTEPYACIGLTNILPDNYRFLQLDYDGFNEAEVIEDLKKLKPYATTFIILETKNGYHVYSPEIYRKSALKSILQKSSCDEQFKVKMREKGYTTLRISPKYEFRDEKLIMVSPAPVYRFIYVTDLPTRPQCKSVVHFLSTLYNTNFMKLSLLSAEIYSNPLQFVYYHTLNA